jgi:hypothetical protein
MARKSFLAELENLANMGITITWDNDKATYTVRLADIPDDVWHGDDLRDLIDEVHKEMYRGT